MLFSNNGAAGNSGINNVGKQSEHVQQRAREGRPVGYGYGNATNARAVDVFVQEDGRWVVQGSNGRISIFEPNGEQVTTFTNSNSNTMQRIADGRWVRLNQEQL